ncbi:hypothetical protein PRABACTJOHN_01020 [Parabacteroides johnsonii DSM 18315]|uniref:Uncharacterized protein n=1 Tax=Parabacteroides johnsonii DSM 18315 TaxID=537006 RepID=B7B7M2_9BACT|nr:hypothetical protein PRABACTJOHN_01020 [Parabacteroides johnsonii DSM 18315]
MIYRYGTWMTRPYKIIVVCRGRALLCPSNPARRTLFSLGGVEPRPYGTPLFYCTPVNQYLYVIKCTG